MASKPLTCPICAASLPDDAGDASPVFPFCSVRCRQVDLLRWCNGAYAIVDQMTPDQLFEAATEAGDPSAFDE